MTANQSSAIDLACKVLRGQLAEAEVDDAQWALVSLASSLGHSQCPPRVVFWKVIADFHAATGFFADISENEIIEWEPMLPAMPNLPSVVNSPPAFHAAP